jgi:hypothetical protein
MAARKLMLVQLLSCTAPVGAASELKGSCWCSFRAVQLLLVQLTGWGPPIGTAYEL